LPSTGSIGLRSGSGGEFFAAERAAVEHRQSLGGHGISGQGRGHDETMNIAFDVKAARIADIPLQEASRDIWDSKYRLKTKSGEPIDLDIEATYERVARALAAVEVPEKREE